MEKYWHGVIYYSDGGKRICGASNNRDLAERMARQIFDLEAMFAAQDARRPVRIEVAEAKQKG